VYPYLALDGFGALGFVPEVGVEGLIGQIVNFAFTVIDVKDTSLTPTTYLSTL
jgi:hypothetical protein